MDSDGGRGHESTGEVGLLDLPELAEAHVATVEAAAEDLADLDRLARVARDHPDATAEERRAAEDALDVLAPLTGRREEPRRRRRVPAHLIPDGPLTLGEPEGAADDD